MKTPFTTKTQIYHDGKWKGISLRSQGGSYTRTDPGGPGLDHFADSIALGRTPYFREVINALKCDKRSVRLLSLPAGAEIGTHVDPYHGLKFGQLRLHCPILTHPDVKMYFAHPPGNRRPDKPGTIESLSLPICRQAQPVGYLDARAASVIGSGAIKSLSMRVLHPWSSHSGAT
jgi:Aspartyl/Asparaginyl beta-hydroxylase